MEKYEAYTCQDKTNDHIYSLNSFVFFNRVVNVKVFDPFHHPLSKLVVFPWPEIKTDLRLIGPNTVDSDDLKS